MCPRCGQTITTETCPHCRERVPAFARARALGAYEGVLRIAVHRLKYRDRPQLAHPLGLLLADYARNHAQDLGNLYFDAVVSIPMHPTRRRLRGYNQSERLASIVAQSLNLPLQSTLLRRTKNTRSQVGLTGNARRQNLRNAFAAMRPHEITGKTFLVIDDVATTGTTLHEAAYALKEAGAKNVFCLTLAAG